MVTVTTSGSGEYVAAGLGADVVLLEADWKKIPPEAEGVEAGAEGAGTGVEEVVEVVEVLEVVGA